MVYDGGESTVGGHREANEEHPIKNKAKQSPNKMARNKGLRFDGPGNNASTVPPSDGNTPLS
jgi:hypothetical protein